MHSGCPDGSTGHACRWWWLKRSSCLAALATDARAYGAAANAGRVAEKPGGREGAERGQNAARTGPGGRQCAGMERGNVGWKGGRAIHNIGVALALLADVQLHQREAEAPHLADQVQQVRICDALVPSLHLRPPTTASGSAGARPSGPRSPAARHRLWQGTGARGKERTSSAPQRKSRCRQILRHAAGDSLRFILCRRL